MLAVGVTAFRTDVVKGGLFVTGNGDGQTCAICPTPGSTTHPISVPQAVKAVWSCSVRTFHGNPVLAWDKMGGTWAIPVPMTPVLS